MNLTLEDRIRERAYFQWLNNAEAGDATHFWLIAEREVLAEVAMESATAFQFAEAAAKRNPESAEHQLARRVNALVQLDSGANREQAGFGLVAG